MVATSKDSRCSQLRCRKNFWAFPAHWIPELGATGVSRVPILGHLAGPEFLPSRHLHYARSAGVCRGRERRCVSPQRCAYLGVSRWRGHGWGSRPRLRVRRRLRRAPQRVAALCRPRQRRRPYSGSACAILPRPVPPRVPVNRHALQSSVRGRRRVDQGVHHSAHVPGGEHGRRGREGRRPGDMCHPPGVGRWRRAGQEIGLTRRRRHLQGLRCPHRPARLRKLERRRCPPTAHFESPPPLNHPSKHSAERGSRIIAQGRRRLKHLLGGARVCSCSRGETIELARFARARARRDEGRHGGAP
mmetsp:Transcript_29396/g.65818  ORF Transcript_29396/g.65818 Transcript_29396/m.65818 type:complete len:302 (+) Transcript_29396:157-1062(+)